MSSQLGSPIALSNTITKASNKGDLEEIQKESTWSQATTVDLKPSSKEKRMRQSLKLMPKSKRNDHLVCWFMRIFISKNQNNGKKFTSLFAREDQDTPTESYKNLAMNHQGTAKKDHENKASPPQVKESRRQG